MSNKHELAGQNRFEMLVFKIGNGLFGINVFKVREIINLKEINSLPGSHENIMGVMTIRGTTMPIIHMSKVLGIKNATDDKGLFVVTEYNRMVQGIKIDEVVDIENISWEDVKDAPSTGSKDQSYLTSVVNIKDKLIQILDVEKILNEINGDDEIEINDISTSNAGKGKRILVVDDSKVAQKQMQKTLELLGFEAEFKNNGKEALDYLIEMSERKDINDHFCAMVTDIEMPQMDGYTLVAELRSRGFSDFKIIMHTSMSGVFNKAMVDKVGADDFIPKFNSKEFQIALLKHTSEEETRIAA